METHDTDWSIFCGKISWLVFAVAIFVNEICTAYLRPLQRQQGGAEFTMGCYRSLKIVLLHKVYVSSYRCYMQMFSVLYSVCIIAIPSSVTTQCHTPILLNSQDTCFEAVDWQLVWKGIWHVLLQIFQRFMFERRSSTCSIPEKYHGLKSRLNGFKFVLSVETVRYVRCVTKFGILSFHQVSACGWLLNACIKF